MAMTILVILVLIAAAVTAVHAYVNGARLIAAVLTLGILVGIIALLTEPV